MIHSFSCKNFYSFKDLVTVNFIVNKHAPKSNGYFKDKSGTILSKTETVIGSNASGKTNLLKALPFMKWLVLESFNLDPSSPIAVQPFKFGKNKENPTELSAEFEIDGTIYLYKFSLIPERILTEQLFFKNKTKEKNTYKTAFSREWDKSSEKYKFNGKNFKFPKDFDKALRKNTSVIGSAIRFNHIPSQKIANFWSHIETNVIETGWIGDYMSANSNINFIDALNFFSENETLKKEAEKLLANFDLGLDSFDIKKEKKDDEHIYIEAKVAHIFNGVKHYLDMKYESSGTRQLFALLKSILLVLNRGGVVVLDEIDVNLHSEIVTALLDLFVQPETNPNNAQLIFSTHSHLVLNKLNKYQIILVEKNKEGISESWRLDEMSGVRSDDNYYLKYITGAYGAFPNII
jgi:hypothetical protein